MGKRKNRQEQGYQNIHALDFQSFGDHLAQRISHRLAQKASPPPIEGFVARCRSPTSREIARMPEGSRGELVAGISRLFNSTDFADLKIYINNHELPAHSVILATQSDYFNTDLTKGFAESDRREFRFTEGSTHAYYRVFEYMYTGQYSENSRGPSNIQDDDELTRDVRVYVLADFFLIGELKEYAIKRLEVALKELWISEGFIDCVTRIYESTNESHYNLRDLVARKAHSGLGKLWAKQQFRELIRNCGEFAVDLTALSANI